MKYRIILIGALALFCACEPETSEAPATATDSKQYVEAPEMAQTQQVEVAPAPTMATADYCNNRYAYCLSYPKDLMLPQPESGNGDGRIFNDKNGREVLRVYGTAALDMDGNPVDLEKQYKSELKDTRGGRKITYSKLGKDYYVVSGYLNERVFYQKTIINDEGFCYAILSYDKEQRGVYDPVSAMLFKSFK